MREKGGGGLGNGVGGAKHFSASFNVRLKSGLQLLALFSIFFTSRKMWSVCVKAPQAIHCDVKISQVVIMQTDAY